MRFFTRRAELTVLSWSSPELAVLTSFLSVALLLMRFPLSDFRDARTAFPLNIENPSFVVPKEFTYPLYTQKLNMRQIILCIII